MVAMNEALILSLLRQQELLGVTEELNAKLRREITERQAAQETLRASEARYRRLFEFIDEGFCTLEKLDTRPGEPSDFRYLSANAGFEKQTGVGGIVGKTIREAFPGEPQEWFDTYDAVMATGEPIRFERELASWFLRRLTSRKITPTFRAPSSSKRKAYSSSVRPCEAMSRSKRIGSPVAMTAS